MFNPRLPRFFNWPALVWIVPAIGGALMTLVTVTYKAGQLSDKLDTVTATTQHIESRLDKDDEDRKKLDAVLNDMHGQLKTLVSIKGPIASNLAKPDRTADQ